MCAVIVTRHINSTKVRDLIDFSLRRDHCARFKSRMEAIPISVSEFARLLGVSAEAISTWRGSTQRCIPPHPMALRILSLVERDRNILKILSEITREESY